MQNAEQEIQQAVLAMADAWSQRDGTRFAQAFGDQVEFINVRGERSSGPPQMTHFKAPVFEASLKEQKLQLQPPYVRLIRPDVASASSPWTLGDAGNTQAPQRHGWMHFLLTRENDRWVILEMHTMEIR